MFLEIKDKMLDTFANDETTSIAAYDDTNYIVLTNLDAQTFRKQVESSIDDLNNILLKYDVFNIINVIFGTFDSSRIEVSFDNAVSRAKQACMLAKTQKTAYAEWDASSGKELEKKIKIEKNIHKEIDNNRFFLEYQPV